VLYWQGMRNSFPQLYAVSSPSTRPSQNWGTWQLGSGTGGRRGNGVQLRETVSQIESERKFSGAGKALSGEQDAVRGAQRPLIAAGGERNIYPLLPPRPEEDGGSQRESEWRDWLAAGRRGKRMSRSGKKFR
jgi:hypothetical protein